MKIKSGFVLREVAGNFIVVAVGTRVKEFNGVINLNDTGAFLWQKLAEGTTEEKLTKSLLEEYEVDEITAKNDIKEFIGCIKEAGLTEE